MANLTKAELIAKGKSLGLTLKSSMLKAEMESAIKKAEKPAKASQAKVRGEK